MTNNLVPRVLTKLIMKGGKLLNIGVIGFSVKSDIYICDAETVGLSKTTLRRLQIYY